MHSLSTHRDLYIGCFCDVNAWGGGVSIGAGLLAAARRAGFDAQLLGVSSRSTRAAVADTAAGGPRANVSLTASPLLWRVQSWRVPGRLAEALQHMPPPRRAFVGVSMYWVIAAKRAWPDVPVVYQFPCLLSNCLPFTWAHGRRPPFWGRVEFAGIRRAEHAAFAAADLTLAPTRHAADEIRAFQGRAPVRLATCLYGCDPPAGLLPATEPRQASRELRLVGAGAAAGASGRVPRGRMSAAVSESRRDRDGRSPQERSRAAIRGELGIGDDDYVVVLAGLMDANKGFDWAIRELPAAEPGIHLVLLGEGPEHSELEALADRLGLAERVHFAGVQREVGAWYAAADCLVSTSYYDTFPNVVLEAMYCDRPVVVPRHEPPHVYAGAAEIVADHGGGRVYDRRRPGALARVLSELSGDRAASETLGREAGALARRLFHWDGCMERIAAVAR